MGNQKWLKFLMLSKLVVGLYLVANVAIVLSTTAYADQLVNVTETYWTMCRKWGVIPYPCKQTRTTATYWCYTNMLVHENNWLVYSWYEGCEPDGTRRKWSGATLGYFESRTCYLTKCFNDRLPAAGSCPYTFDPTIVMCATNSTVGDDDGDGIDDNTEQALLNKFRPYFLFSKDTVDGALTEEHYNPADVLWYIQQSELLDTGNESASPIMNNNALNASPSAILTVSSPYSSSNIIGNPAKTNYHINPLETAHGVSDDPGRHGQPWSDILQKKNVGLYGHVVRANRNYQRNTIQRKDDPNNPYDYYKIEYWQFFGYNNANKPFDMGDHEGDWATVQLLYDPQQDKVVSVFHYAHGSEIRFDMVSALNCVVANAPWGNYEECRGTNYGGSFDDAGINAQNNTIRLYQDPQTHDYTHPVVYVEYGTHEFWPTEAGVYHAYWHGIDVGQAPPHRGDDVNHRYFTESPPNLGEVEAYTMTSPAANIVLKYNGYWGAFSHKNSPPPGPPLHTEWTWPANSRIRPLITNYLEN